MTKNSQNQNDYQVWQRHLDRICMKRYLIDTSDMGFDVDQLNNFWSQNSTPVEMADHFGTKYDLTLAQDVLLRD